MASRARAPRRAAPLAARDMKSTTLDQGGPPAAEAVTLPAQPRIPKPTAVALAMFPCAVKLPGGSAVAVAKVYFTPQGVYVYDRRPANVHSMNSPNYDPDGLGEGAVRFFARVDYSKTPRPDAGYRARNAGNRIDTDAGAIIVVPLGGCGCSHGSLKRWSPSWAQRRISWEALTS